MPKRLRSIASGMLDALADFFFAQSRLALLRQA